MQTMKKPVSGTPKSIPSDPEPRTEKKPPSKARAPRKNAPKPAGGLPPLSITTIAARTDVGFGNVLFIRGGGPGLSWEFGMPMTCQNDDLWTFDVLDAEKPVAFKFLINDETWSTGPDYVVEPGAQLEVTPFF
jgi:hypothetical protein